MYSIPNLPDRLTREIYAELCTSLPSPATATPEGRASRDERAMTAVAHYLPENAAEAELAAQIVAATSMPRTRCAPPPPPSQWTTPPRRAGAAPRPPA
jgi:hypothetical protein